MSVARCLLLVVILVSSVGLGVFLSGFLLTKTELRQRSYGEEHHDPAKIFRDIDIDNKSSYDALMRYNSEIREGSSRKGKRVFLFVVDALRFDLFQPSDEMEAMCERCIRTYIHTYIHTCTYPDTYIYIYICSCLYIHTYIHTYKHTYKHTYIQTCTYAYTCVHAYMNTLIH